MLDRLLISCLLSREYHFIFFSTVFAVFSTQYHLFSTPPQLFSTPPPNFSLPTLFYPIICGAHSSLSRYMHPFGLYKRLLQPAHTSTTRLPTRPATTPPPCHPTPTLPHPASNPSPHLARPATPFPHLDPHGPPQSAAGVIAAW